jgi:molybdate transport system substrate-binding protein
VKLLFRLLSVLAIVLTPAFSHAAQSAHLTIAAAADLHHAMDEVVAAYRRDHPAAAIDVIYGASGVLLTQIEQGAPFDLFFSADSDYPRRLIADGQAGGPATTYAVGHLVLWSASLDMRGVRVSDLAEPRFGRIAIANPEHAPYGKRAEQALRGAGIWSAVAPRLVYGENIAQAAQFARSGAAEVGIIARSLALEPGSKGSYAPVPDSAFQPLLQSFVLTKPGAHNDLAQDFARYVQGAPARAILARYGFTPPSADAKQ